MVPLVLWKRDRVPPAAELALSSSATPHTHAHLTPSNADVNHLKNGLLRKEQRALQSVGQIRRNSRPCPFPVSCWKMSFGLIEPYFPHLTKADEVTSLVHCCHYLGKSPRH